MQSSNSLVSSHYTPRRFQTIKTVNWSFVTGIFSQIKELQKSYNLHKKLILLFKKHSLLINENFELPLTCNTYDNTFYRV